VVTESGGDQVEVIVEEVRADVEGHRRRRVAQHPLDRFDVRAGRDREARRGLPQVVRGDAREVGIVGPDARQGRIEPAAPDVAAAEDAAVRTGEDEVVRQLARVVREAARSAARGVAETSRRFVAVPARRS
jgi:hypothetical protein